MGTEPDDKIVKLREHQQIIGVLCHFHQVNPDFAVLKLAAFGGGKGVQRDYFNPPETHTTRNPQKLYELTGTYPLRFDDRQ